MKSYFILLIFALAPFGHAGDQKKSERPFLRAELLFPLEHWHNHGSCLIQCPNDDLLVCWYHGSGERTADDVVVLGARQKKNATTWSAPFLLADTPGYPDTNPAMFIDPRPRLWLMWPTILNNHWETALMKYRISTDYQKSGPPQWDSSEVLHVTPGTNFQPVVEAALAQLSASQIPDSKADRFDAWIKEKKAHVADKLYCRLGWMTRVHPQVIDGRRLIVPLYSDGFDFSLMAITDDWGKTWFASEPLIGHGNVQPSIVQKKDGTLVAYMRDNGPPPKRIPVSHSTDRGVTWSKVVDSDRLDSGTGVEAIVLQNGLWLLTHNDLEKGRHQLAVSLSDDEGKTWKWTRHLEQDSEADVKAGAGSYHYPSVIQAKDGTVHVSYSIHQKKSETKLDTSGKAASESIKHAHFNIAWVMQGD